MRFPFLLTLTLAAAAMRLLPHPDNFAPVAALALFGASTFEKRWQAIVVPFVALLLSDLGLQILFTFGLSASRGFHSLSPLIMLCFAGVIGIGLLLRNRINPGTVVAASLAGSLFFFVVTNFAVWYSGEVGYSPDAAGLLLCYEAGLPFFWPTLAGDLFYSAALFGGYALAIARFPQLRLATAEN